MREGTHYSYQWQTHNVTVADSLVWVGFTMNPLRRSHANKAIKYESTSELMEDGTAFWPGHDQLQDWKRSRLRHFSLE